MARQWRSPAAQRWALHGALVVVLLGTMGLAAAVTWSRARSMEVSLAPAVVRNGVSYRLPHGWKPVRFRVDQKYALVVAAVEPPDRPLRREVQVLLERHSRSMDLQDYLPRSDATVPGLLVGEVDVAGQRGLLVAVQHLDSPQRISKKLIVVAIFPSLRTSLIIRLSGPGEVTRGDIALIERMARSLSLVDSEDGVRLPDEDSSDPDIVPNV